jgi:hypothetical protein
MMLFTSVCWDSSDIVTKVVLERPNVAMSFGPLGTVIGVLVIPGLYYLFGRMADGRSLIKDEHDEPLTEIFER